MGRVLFKVNLRTMELESGTSTKRVVFDVQQSALWRKAESVATALLQKYLKRRQNFRSPGKDSAVAITMGV